MQVKDIAPARVIFEPYASRAVADQKYGSNQRSLEPSGLARPRYCLDMKSQPMYLSLSDVIDSGLAFFENIVDDVRKRYEEPSDMSDVMIWVCFALPTLTLFYYYYKNVYTIIFACALVVSFTGLSLAVSLFYFMQSAESSFMYFYFSGVYVISGMYLIKSILLTSPFLFFIFVDISIVISLSISIIYYCQRSIDPKEILKGSVRPWFYLTVVILSFCLNAMLLNVFTYYNHFGKLEINMVSMTGKVSSVFKNYTYTAVLTTCFVFFVSSYTVYHLSTIINDFFHTRYHKRWVLIYIIMFLAHQGGFTSYGVHASIYSYSSTTYQYVEEQMCSLYGLIPLLVVIFVTCLSFYWVYSAFNYTSRYVSKEHPPSPTPWWLVFLLCAMVFLTLAATLAVHKPVPVTYLADIEQYCDEEIDSKVCFSSELAGKCRRVNRYGRHDITLPRLAFMEYLDDTGQKRELRVIESIASYWKDLAITFGLDWRLIALNRNNEVDYAKNCCYDVLNVWLIKSPPGYPRSWDSLVKALRNIEVNSVADDIETALNYCILK